MSREEPSWLTRPQASESAKKWRWGLGLHLAVTAVVSLLAYTSSLPEAWLELPLLDKFGHFLLVGGAAFWLRNAFEIPDLKLRGGRIPPLMVLAMTLALIDEAVQIAAPNRNADILDLVSGLGGMLLFWHLAGRWRGQNQGHP